MKTHRRQFLKSAGFSTAAVVAAPRLVDEVGSRSTSGFTTSSSTFELDEVTVAELHSRQRAGGTSAQTLAHQYLERIEALDRRGPALCSVIEVNPEALVLAERLDREREQDGVRGALHGIPVLIKDNIDTHDCMSTTAGSLALKGSRPLRDAFLVKQLRNAGAIILGKTNLSEWANFRGNRSTSGWSALGGQSRNPYSLDRDPSGSSSGSAVAVAANLCAAAIGTETDGSILSPSLRCGIVGIKPTVGLVSRSGIIPISHTQDTAGPMARTVTDAATLLGAMTGQDPRDPSTESSGGRAYRNYTQFLDKEGLRGARIGVVRKTFTGHPEVGPLMERLLARMQQQGATLVSVELPADANLWAAEYEVLLYEFKAGLNRYLAELGSGAPVKTLREIIEFNDNHPLEEMPWFGQEIFLEAEAKGSLTDNAYLTALAKCRRASREEGIDALMEEHRLDAIFTSGGGPAAVRDYAYGDRDTGGGGISTAAVAGYPSVTVPAGFILGLPVGVIFIGRAWDEPVLLRLAYAVEQLNPARRVPSFHPTLRSISPESASA